MKKFFTLMTLLLTVVGGVRAADNITVTWLPNNMTTATMAGTASEDGILTVSDITLSSDVETASSLGTWDSKKWVTFLSKTVSTAAGPKNGINKDDYLTFTVTVKAGYTFTPTSVTAYAVGSGTGNNGVGIFTETLSSNMSSGYTAKNSSSAKDVTPMTKAITSSALTEGNTYTFYIYFSQNNTSSGKGVGMRDVVLSGEYVDLSSPDAAPTITTNLPTTQSANVGVETSLSVEVTGKPAPTFEWYSCDDASGTNPTKIDDATSKTYTFTPATAGTFYYYVKVINSEGDVTSNIVALTVVPATPTIKVVGSRLVTIEGTAGATIYYELNNADIKTSATKKTYSGVFIPESSGTLYVYQTIGGTDSEVASKAITLPVVGEVTGDLLIKLVPDAPASDTDYDSNTFTKAGYKLVNTAKLTNTNTMAKSPHMFKVQKGTLTITPPSDVTIKSIKVYGVSNDDNKTNNVQKESDAMTVTTTDATLIPRNTIIGDAAVLSEILMTVASPTEGTEVKFKIGGDAGQARFYVEVYGTTSATTESITPAKEYTTYVPTHNLDFTDHAKLTAYIATAANSTSVTLTKVEKVPAGTPIVLEATETGSAISVPVATSTDAVSGNLLKAGDGTTTIGGDSKFDYILVDSKFYRAEEGKVAVGKAYLHLESEPTGARTLDLNIGGGGATGIETIKVGTDDNVYYDLQGRRVLYPTKGLYIVNGKKVILK